MKVIVEEIPLKAEPAVCEICNHAHLASQPHVRVGKAQPVDLAEPIHRRPEPDEIGERFQTSLYINRSCEVRLRLIAAQERKKVTECIHEAIEAWLKSKGFE